MVIATSFGVKTESTSSKLKLNHCWCSKIRLACNKNEKLDFNEYTIVLLYSNLCIFNSLGIIFIILCSATSPQYKCALCTHANSNVTPLGPDRLESTIMKITGKISVVVHSLLYVKITSKKSTIFWNNKL